MASNLLAPRTLFLVAARRRSLAFRDILAPAKAFDTSLTSTALRSVKLDGTSTVKPCTERTAVSLAR